MLLKGHADGMSRRRSTKAAKQTELNVKNQHEKYEEEGMREWANKDENANENENF